MPEFNLDQFYKSLSQGGGYMSTVGTGGAVGYRGPAGPSKPGFVQGTANTIPTTARTAAQRAGGSVLGAASGGAVGAAGGSQPSLNLQGVLEQAPGQPSIDFDSLIAPALQALDSSIAPLQQQSEANIQGIEADKTKLISRAQADLGKQETSLESARTRQNQEGESAANEARRQFSEIQQGLQARYGGTTGTGAFASEIAGRQTMQNIGQIRQGLSNAMMEIDNKLSQVREIATIQIQDIEDQSRGLISQEKARLEQSLADIRRQKGELQGRKAELAMQAMQIYQNTVNEINARNAQFKQQLFVQQQQAENQLRLAQQRAQQVSESYSLYNLSQGNQMTPVRVGNKTGAVQPLNIPGGQGKLEEIGTPNQNQKAGDPLDDLIRQLALQQGGGQ